jgi:hypothetical protein
MSFMKNHTTTTGQGFHGQILQCDTPFCASEVVEFDRDRLEFVCGEHASEQLDALERKYMTLAQKEIEAREKAGFEVSHEWLDSLERKHIALALQELTSNI